MADDLSSQSFFPLECRDQYQEAEQYYNNPLRVENRALKDEILSLKRLLRENSIPWNSKIDAGHAPKRIKTRLTRSSFRSATSVNSCPPLPVEIQLQILTHALTAKDPIIDPLCKLKMENLSEQEQKGRKNGYQLAIGLLATCKAYHAEGTRILWTRNEFVFTTHQAVREFCNVPFEFRSKVERVTLRIIAHYYDEEKKCPHPGPRRLKPIRNGGNAPARQRTVRVTDRPKEESTLARRGFRSYTWTQVVDFLNGLRPPFDPSHTGSTPRPRLLPGLKSIRIDFVDFPAGFLRSADMELHSLAFHDLGCTLDELMVTGLPDCTYAAKVLVDLTGMVKDDGLLLKCKAAFIAKTNHLSARADCAPTAQVVRSWKPLAKEWGEYFPDDFDEDEWDFHDYHDHHHHHPIGDLPVMPPAPEEEGHPESAWLERRTIWKRVPESRDSAERKWVEFGRVMGTPVGPYSEARDVDDEGELVCPTCGIMHDPAGWEL
ncbi:hypothetical protein V8F33_003746 [Rhypophila sp. PSN 637]